MMRQFRAKKMKTEWRHCEDLPSGTSLVGVVSTTFAKIREVFGEPTVTNPDSKTNVEWRIMISDPTTGSEYPMTIYDWKMPTVPTERYMWHIGGRTAYVMQFAEKMVW